MQLAPDAGSSYCQKEVSQESGLPTHSFLGPDPYELGTKLHDIWNDAGLAAEQELAQFERHMVQRRAANLQDLATWSSDLVVGKFDIEARWACHAMVWSQPGARAFIRTTELRIDAWIEAVTEKALPATCVGDLRLRLLERQRFWKAEALKRLRDIEATVLHLRTTNVPEINRATPPLAEQASREQQECIEQTDPATDCGSTSTREGEESPPAPDSMEIPERTRKFLNNLLSSEGVRFDESVERYWQELVETGELPSEIVAEMRRDRRLYEDEFVSLHADFLERIADASWPKSLKLAKQFGLERFEFCADSLSRRLALFGNTENATPLLESYELLLGYFKNLIVAQLSEILVNLPSRRRDNVLSNLGCKLSARILKLMHTAKNNHLDGKPLFAVSSRMNATLVPIPNRDQESRVAARTTGENSCEPDCTQAEQSKYPRKGDPAILDGKSAVNFSIAEQYLGISERRRQQLLKEGVLQRAGKGRNTLVTVTSLLALLPPSKITRKNPKSDLFPERLRRLTLGV